MTKKNINRVLQSVSVLLIASISLCSQEIGQPATHQQSRFPLHEAVTAGDINKIQLLVRQGALVITGDSVGKTPFHVACENGNIETVTCLFSLAPDMLARDRNGMTPLHYASEKGHTDIVKFLIDTAAVSTLNNKNIKGDSPLHLATKHGHREVVQVLLRVGADIEACNNYEQTPLHVAASNGHTGVVRCLIQVGARAVARAADEEFSDEDDESLNEGDESSSEDRGFVNTKDSEGNTPLHLACKNGHLEVVRTLVEAGASMEARASLDEEPKDINSDLFFSGLTALGLACDKGHTEIAKLLIRCGAKADPVDYDDHLTPLFRAIKKGYFDIVQQLIKAHAHTYDVMNIGFSHAIHYAALGPNAEIVKFFIQETPEDIDSQDIWGNTPLHWAAQWNCLHNAELLLSADAEIKLNVSHYTPLGLLLHNYKGLDNPFEPLSEEARYKEWIEKIRPTVQFFVELDMNNISTETRALLDRLYPEHRTWLAGRKKFVNKLFEESLQLPSDIAQLLHEFIFNVEKKRKRDTKTDQRSNKKSRN